MSKFLQKSELTERRAFIETFVKEIEVMPDNAVVRYAIPMPNDSFIPARKAEELAPNGSVVWVRREIAELRGLAERAMSVVGSKAEAKLTKLREILREQGFFEDAD